MLRKPLFYMPDIPVYIVQRSSIKEAIIFDESNYAVYFAWLKESLKRIECQLHAYAYVLMINHVHFLATPNTKKSFSRMMQYIGRRYVPYINHQYDCTGILWERHYKSSLVL